jgi:hypothetical protein
VEPLAANLPHNLLLGISRSCIRLRSKNGLEEFRLDLAHRKMARKVEPKARPHPCIRTAEDQNRLFDGLIPQTRAIAQEDKFYFEELALDFLCEMESER